MTCTSVCMSDVKPRVWYIICSVVCSLTFSFSPVTKGAEVIISFRKVKHVEASLPETVLGSMFFLRQASLNPGAEEAETDKSIKASLGCVVQG